MTFEDTKCALNMYYIFFVVQFIMRDMRSFLLRLFITKILFVLNLTKVERRKLKSSLRIALWAKSKKCGYHGRVVGFYHLVNKALKLFEAKVFELLT